MSGFCGRRRSLRSCRLGQWNRWCSTVSLGCRQSWQVAGWSFLMRFRWLFSCTCPVLSLKIIDCSSLWSLLIGSLGLGLVMWLKTALPVVFVAQLLSHSSCKLDFIIWTAVSYDTGTSGWGRLAPCLARVSASSFPLSQVWPGIHCSTTLIECSFISWLRC